MYYHSNFKNLPTDDTVLYSELLDNESISSESEMLRVSYRICYSILDKIALGICKLYKISEPGENIFFERFWNPGKKSTRWEKLNQVKNIHLNALYSIACDLNTKKGELKHFKTWRNKLEHEALILKNNFETDDELGLFNDNNFFECVNEQEFKEKTLHLLQLTRSAIFSFVYCVRLETIDNISGDEKVFVIDFKNKSS